MERTQPMWRGHSCPRRSLSAAGTRTRMSAPHRLIPHKLISHLSPGLFLYKPGKHLLWVDGDKRRSPARQHFALLIQDLSDVDVFPSRNTLLARLDAQRFIQRHRLQEIDRHLRSKRNNLPKLVHLAHRLIKNGRNDSTVAMSRRSGIALAQPDSADEAIAVFVIGEAQEHTIRVVLAAGEAVVLLEPQVLRAVSRPCLLGSLPGGCFGLGLSNPVPNYVPNHGDNSIASLTRV